MYAENRANLNTSSDARNVEVVASQWPMEQAGGNAVAAA